MSWRTSRVLSSIVVVSCGIENVSEVQRTDATMTTLERQLASGADNTALCVEYLGLCEQGLALCLEGTNAQTYQSFCSGLQARCNTTVEQFCRRSQADAGTPDAGTPPPDAGAGPLITAVSAVNVTQTTATISWALNQPGTGQVEYGTTASYGQASRKETSFQYSAHLQALSGLAPATQYHFRVRSSNQAGLESISGDFTFTTAGNNTAPDAGTGGGLHAPPPTSTLVVSVKSTGATGNGSTDDTAAIQAAVNQVGGTGGTVLVPSGTYLVDALTAITLKSSMTFRMESGAVLKAIPNASGSYQVLKTAGASNLNIIGGTIKGERNEHLTPGNIAITTPTSTSCPNRGNCWGQWGMGLAIQGGSKIFIEGVLARDCWGDGFYVNGAATNVTFASVVADGNRRQGLSLVDANGVVIRDSVFKNTVGHNPQAGIDLETNPSTRVTNVQILNCRLEANHFSGIALNGRAGPVTNVTISGSTSLANANGIRAVSASNVRVTNNTVSNNRVLGISWDSAVTGSVITGNAITGPMCLSGSTTGNTVSGNTCN